MKEASLLPTLPVQIRLEASFLQLMHSTNRLMERLNSVLPPQLDDLLHQLGVPGRSEVEFTVADNKRSNPLPLTLRVNSRECDYSWEVTQQLYSYLSDTPFDETILREELEKQLHAWCSQESEEVAQTRIIELIRSICIEAIKLKPSVLLGPEQLLSYREQLRESLAQSHCELTPHSLPTVEWLGIVLGFALDHKLTIATSATLPNSEVVSTLLLNSWRQGMTEGDAGEELMDALVPQSATVEIHFAPGYLRELTEPQDTKARSAFSGLRQGIYDEFGVSLPGLKFAQNPTLKLRAFTLRINAHLLKPRVGPLSASEVSNTLIPLDYIVRALHRDLCANLHCMFPRWAAYDYVSGLEHAFPTLLRIGKDRFNQTQRARVLRAFLADQIPLRNLRLILERMLD